MYNILARPADALDQAGLAYASRANYHQLQSTHAASFISKWPSRWHGYAGHDQLRHSFSLGMVNARAVIIVAARRLYCLAAIVTRNTNFLVAQPE